MDRRHSTCSTVGGQVEYFQLWDCIAEITLTQEQDVHIWSAYRAFFTGSVTFGPWQRLWKTWAPAKCKFFSVAHHP
jgi:hypothetical protein